eukprot:XP_008187472.1 PREDICTED: uncharacterized protein LOC103307615 [Acyrthosiphon pisum]
MLKHILLALCFMAYIIENIGELEPRQRKDQFDRLVKCYDQMFSYGVITTVKGIRNVGNFKTLLIDIYTKHKLKTITHSGDAPETSVNNQGNNIRTFTSEISVDSTVFKNEDYFGIFKNIFTYRFKDVWEPQDLITKFNKMKYISSVYPDPINKFINEYSSDNATEYLRSASLFCAQYSVYPTFEEPVFC